MPLKLEMTSVPEVAFYLHQMRWQGMWGSPGWLLQEEKQLEKLELHAQLCPCRPSSLPAPHFSPHELICPDSCQISPLAPGACFGAAAEVHSSFKKLFQSYLGANYTDLKLFIGKGSSSSQIVSRGYVNLWCQNLSAKCKSAFGYA